MEVVSTCHHYFHLHYHQNQHCCHQRHHHHYCHHRHHHHHHRNHHPNQNVDCDDKGGDASRQAETPSSLGGEHFDRSLMFDYNDDDDDESFVRSDCSL